MTETSPPKYQRRKVIVKRALQFKYASVIFLSAFLAALLVALDTYLPMARMVLSENPGMAQPLSQLHTMLLFKIGLYLVIILLIALYVSHRFAGPIHRFEKSAQIAASGNLAHRVALRTGDELGELQEEFNGMLSGLQSLVQKDRNLAARISAKLADIIDGLPKDKQGQDLKKDLSSLKIELDHLTKAFKV